MSYLLLRPLAKCPSSLSAFTQAGLDCITCALLDTEINSRAVASLPEWLSQLRHDSLLLVTSTVAAEQLVNIAHDWPATTVFLAVGQSTADILIRAGIQVLVPDEPRSEGLLALPQLHQVAGRQVVIFKGFGGRDLLTETLRKRGAEVLEYELYQRVKLPRPVSSQQWQEAQIQCIIATSGEVIEAAFAQFAPQWLQSTLWMVVSERTAQIARQLGVQRLLISHNASDQALIDCALQSSGVGQAEHR